MNRSSHTFRRILDARDSDPHAVLGRHVDGRGNCLVRAFLPDATEAWVEGRNGRLGMHRLHESGLFEWRGSRDETDAVYRIAWLEGTGETFSRIDPYCFAPRIPDSELHLFGQGEHPRADRILGAHADSIDGMPGVLFAVWAPNAQRVSIVGDFNRWDGRVHPMQRRGGSGVWELFMPGVTAGALYKFEIRDRRSGRVAVKTDPYGRQFELRPANAAVVTESRFHWNDAEWMEARTRADWLRRPLSIYEIHLGSWQRDEDGGFLSYRELAHHLVDYVKRQGFTHIELLPITEHPLDGSWGYQCTGYFAPTSRFGTPDDCRYFVNHCHLNGIGVLLDWVPGHFPRDEGALARFDGEPLYEHADPRRGEHREWGTLIFDYGRKEVRSFLISSAKFWLEEFHVDGLRVDAVASMLYLDYAREPDDWVPNIHGGNENLDAIEFLRELNRIVHEEHPGALTMAEESTSWPMVSRPVWMGGLGFSMKWNMGWMNDTLQYMHKEPAHRPHHHGLVTFGLTYAFAENFILPLSHDEVVHLKRSMPDKMPGDEWQRLANLRLLYTYQFTYPGKKLLFMGCEYGQEREWDFDGALDWHHLEDPRRRGVRRLVADLNRLYRERTGLHRYDFDERGFEWIDCHEAAQSLLSFVRRDERETLAVVLNFTPVPRDGYRLGVPAEGDWKVVFNSDSGYYGGSNAGSGGTLRSEPLAWMGRPNSIVLGIPPLGGLILRKDDAGN